LATGDVPAVLLVVACAWASAARGGADASSLLIIGAMLVAALVSGRRPSGSRGAPVVTMLGLAVAANLVWLVIDGPIRVGWTASAVLLPTVLALTWVAALTAARLDRDQRATVVRGLIALGVLHSTLAVGAALVRLIAATDLQGWPRVESTLGNANALGVLVAASTALTLGELRRSRQTPLVFAATLQCIAVLLTASRLAIVLELVYLGWYAGRTARRSARVVVSFWAVAALLVGIARFAHSWPDERVALWAAAIDRISQHPLVGSGSTPRVYDLELAGARPTTHAHNELLQWTVEYGVVGLLLAAVALLAVVRRALRTGRGTADGWVLAAALGLLAGGLTDVLLRVPAVALPAAILTAMAVCAVGAPGRPEPGSAA
jgi:O-antigen ligase